MKLYRNAIILVVIFGLLIGAYLVFSKSKSTDSTAGTTTSETTTAEKVVKFDTDKVTGMTVQNKNGTFDFVKKNDAWEYTEAKKGFKLSSEIIDTMLNSLSDVDAVKVVEKNASNLSQYGFDKPITVTVKTKSGTDVVMEVGNTTSSGDYYLKLKDSSKVYTVGSYVCDSLAFGLNDITDTTLFTSNADDIKMFSLQKRGEMRMVAKKNASKIWWLTSPVEGQIDSDMMDSILKSITQSVIVTYAERNAADLDLYGLKDPAYIVEVETAKGDTKMLLGKEDKVNGVFFARLEGSNDVFTIDSSSYTYIDKPLKEFIVPLVYLQDINKVSKVVVEMDGKKTVCNIDSDKNDLTKENFTVNGKSANVKDSQGNSAFKLYYEALIGINFDTIGIGAKPTGKPDVTITYTLKDNAGTVKIEYIPKDSDYYYAMKDGKYTNFLVLRKQLDDADGVRAMYKQLMSTIK